MRPFSKTGSETDQNSRILNPDLKWLCTDFTMGVRLYLRNTAYSKRFHFSLRSIVSRSVQMVHQ